MPLSRWLKHCSELLQTQYPLHPRRRRFRRSLRQRLAAISARAGLNSEQLEDRVLPANLSWVGDVNHSWRQRRRKHKLVR
ncbi:MAG UNVERIFIED_CONTAM: hypothetical protein LVR18_47685 [Planctomycetaceae bacterium]